MEFVVFLLQQFLQAAHEISVHDMSFKSIILKLRPHLQGDNEFRVLAMLII